MAVRIRAELLFAGSPDLICRVFLSSQVQELFDGEVALPIGKQRRSNLEPSIFRCHAENDCSGQVCSPNAPDAGVRNSGSARLKQASGQN